MRNIAVFQTTNRCSYRCTICPYAQTHNDETTAVMPIDLFTTILTRLRSSEPCRNIGFGFNYDPLTDHLLVQRCEIARQFKFGPLFIQTIGLQNRVHLDTIISTKSIDELVVSIPGGERFEDVTGIPFSKQIDNIRSIADACARQTVKLSIKVTSFDLTKTVPIIAAELPWSTYNVYYATICTRLGKIPGVSKVIDPQSITDDTRHILPDRCSRTEQNIYINVDGTVSLCCQDWGKQLVIGNLVTDSAINRRMEEDIHRSILSTKCKHCFNDIIMENPHVWN